MRNIFLSLKNNLAKFILPSIKIPISILSLNTLKNLMKIAIRTLLAVSFLVLTLSFQLTRTLSVTIRDELGNTVEGAKVTLYQKEDDYNKELNPVADGLTDAKGVVKFRDLTASTYFVLAKKDDKDNAGGGEQTGKLEPNRTNKVTIVIQ